MTSPVWVTTAGFLGTLTERITTSTALIASGTNVAYTVISGSLPGGMKLNQSSGNISGTPLSAPTVVTSNFVVRAQNTSGVCDRTFSLDIVGPTAPIWATPSGLLPTGIDGEYFAINNEYVDITVRATTDILANGNHLKYYIADNQGELPPGLTITPEGRIYGYVSDTLGVDSQSSITGGYDSDIYDRYPYDFGVITNNVTETIRPTNINKTYNFYVTVTDGIISSQREFGIEVVSPSSLLTVNNEVVISPDQFTNTNYLVPAVWKDQYGNFLPPVYDLGVIRASRHQIITLYEYDAYPSQGTLTWDWSTTVNPEVRITSHNLTSSSGTQTTNLIGQNQIYVSNITTTPTQGMQIRLDEYLPDFDTTTYSVEGYISLTETTGIINLNIPLVNTIPDNSIIFIGSPSVHPYGFNLDEEDGELYGTIPYQPAYNVDYKFTINLIKSSNDSTATVVRPQIFTMTIRGDINSYIEFISTSSLGVLIPGQISELSVIAENINSSNAIEYNLAEGSLPSGLTLSNDGSIQGRVDYLSQTYFDFTSTNTFNTFTLDGGDTTIDENWHFTVSANDVYKTNSVEKDFYITVEDDSVTEYTRVFVKPFMASSDRNTYNTFISNPIIFDKSLMYRPNDPEFGVQPTIQMMIEFGLEKVPVADYVDAIQDNFTRKNLYFGNTTSTVATDNTGTAIYELVYVEIIDNQMLENTTPTNAISIENMQTQLESIMVDSTTTISINYNLQPRYMTTLQPSGIPLGYIKAVPICYALPGNSAKILSRIRSSGFDFEQFNFEVDRIIIETPLETTENGWIFFNPNRQ